MSGNIPLGQLGAAQSTRVSQPVTRKTAQPAAQPVAQPAAQPAAQPGLAQGQTKTNQSPVRSQDEINKEILSSFIDKPEFEDFEKGRAAAVLKMNEKYATLIKAEQDIQGDIDRFNNEMSNLLNLKDAHKQPFDLTSIQLERLNLDGSPNESLPAMKPNPNGKTQYFTVLKCDSEKCDKKHRLMAIYQFDNENKIIDENFKGRLDGLEQCIKGDLDNAVGGPPGGPPPAAGPINHDEVQYITSNYDEAYTELMFNNENILNLVLHHTNIPNNKKYRKINNTPLFPPPTTPAVARQEYEKNPEQDSPNINNYCVFAGKDNIGFKCGCKTHSKRSFSEFGITVQRQKNCQDEILISRLNPEAPPAPAGAAAGAAGAAGAAAPAIDSGATYYFHPLDGSRYEPKTIFFCTHCKKFMRYECLRGINKEKEGIKYDNTLLNQLSQGLLETLPVINADMLFRTPLFSEDYNEWLEKTARSLKTTLIAELEDPKKLLLKGTSMLGEIVGDMNIDIDYSKKNLVKEIFKEVGKGIKNTVVSQMGGADTGVSDPTPCDQHQRDITMLSERLKSGARSPRLAVAAPQQPPQQPQPQQPQQLQQGQLQQQQPPAPGGATTGNRRANNILGMTGATIDFGNQYGKLSLQKTYGEFEKELKKWSVCKGEDGILGDMKAVKSDKTGVSDNDKKPYRGRFFELQRSYIVDFETQFGEEMRKFFPFLSQDFDFLKSLRIEGDKDGLDKDLEIKLFGRELSTEELSDLDSIQLSIQDADNKIRLEPSIARRVREFSGNKTPTNEDILKISCGLSFSPLEIEPNHQLYRYLFDQNRQGLRDYLDRYGKLDPVRENYYNRGGVGRDIVYLIIQRLAGTDHESNPELNGVDIDFQGDPPQGTAWPGTLSEAISIYSSSLPRFKYTLSADKIYGKISVGEEEDNPNKYDTINNSRGNNLDKIPDLKKLRDCFPEGATHMNFGNNTDGVKRFNTVKESLNFVGGFKTKFNELEERYRKLSEEIKQDYRTKFKDKDPDIKDPKFRNVVQKMCGGNSGLFWYGDTIQSYKFDDYQKARSILSRLGILYLPWYDISFVEKIMDKKIQDIGGFVNEFHILQSKNLKGDKNNPTGNFIIKDDNGGNYGEKLVIDKELLKLDDPNWDNYRKQVLPLFPLLRVNDSQTQLIVGDNGQESLLTGKFRITQLKDPDSFLSGCYSMDNYSKFGEDGTIWVKPKTKDGLDIKTPIQILRLKQKIKDKAKAFYNASDSLKYDKMALKKYEKEYANYLKQLDKSRKAKEKEAKAAAKHLEKMRKEELKALRDTKQQEIAQEQMAQQQLAQQQLAQEQLAQEQLAQQQLEQGKMAQQVEQQATDLSQDKLYTKDDVSKASSELDKLKMEMKRRETVLKNIASNIKLLKSQRHGDDSEQRQLQQREYEQKERELILFQKLVEQREEKLKVLKILTDKLSAKDEKEKSEMMRRDEINKQQNFLSLQNEMNNITENNKREMSDSLSSIQKDEISDLKSKLNSLEGGETDIQREIVQNGGGRNRKDDLRGLLYKTKTESRKNRTKKKKGRKARNNERKKDRSLRKRN